MSLPEDILDFMGKAAKIRLSEPPTKSDGAPHLYEAHDGGGNVVCFDIGSSGRLGLIRDPVLMLQVFANALKVINRYELPRSRERSPNFVSRSNDQTYYL